MNYGRALRIVRAAKGMSQKEVADRSNIQPSYLSLLEAGKRANPSMRRLEGIAAALGVPLDLLMLLAEEGITDDPLRPDEATRIGKAMLDLLREGSLSR